MLKGYSWAWFSHWKLPNCNSSEAATSASSRGENGRWSGSVPSHQAASPLNLLAIQHGPLTISKRQEWEEIHNVPGASPDTSHCQSLDCRSRHSFYLRFSDKTDIQCLVICCLTSYRRTVVGRDWKGSREDRKEWNGAETHRGTSSAFSVTVNGF